jgi:hypothetical protein
MQMPRGLEMHEGGIIPPALYIYRYIQVSICVHIYIYIYRQIYIYIYRHIYIHNDGPASVQMPRGLEMHEGGIDLFGASK